MGIGYYDEGISIDRAMRAQAVQRFMMSKMSGSSYDLPADLTVNLLSRAKSIQQYGVGRGKMGGDFADIMQGFFQSSVAMAPYALEMVGMILEDRQKRWATYNKTQRQGAYLAYMNQKVTGQGNIDADTMAFLQNQLKDDPDRQTYINNAVGNNTTAAGQLSAALGFTVWWKNALVWAGIGVGVLGIGGLIAYSITK